MLLDPLHCIGVLRTRVSRWFQEIIEYMTQHQWRPTIFLLNTSWYIQRLVTKLCYSLHVYQWSHNHPQNQSSTPGRCVTNTIATKGICTELTAQSWWSICAGCPRKKKGEKKDPLFQNFGRMYSRCMGQFIFFWDILFK